jgi:hypothetical protein
MQILGDFLWACPVNGRAPERLPRRVLHFASDALRCPIEPAAFALALPNVGLILHRFRVIRQHPLHGAVAASAAGPFTSGQERTEFIANDRE